MVLPKVTSAEELEEQKSADAQDEEQSFELEEIESDAAAMPLVEPTVLVKDNISASYAVQPISRALAQPCQESYTAVHPRDSVLHITANC